MKWLEIHFIWFVLYSIIGWIWEVIICSLPQKKFINRGFLNGPYCPIYGAGSILIIIFLNRIDSAVLLFLIGALLTCILEYITSWLMEKLFHARWWDYSKNFLNINGRVCFKGAIAFGALSVLLMKIIHPFIENITSGLSELAISIMALSLFTIILIDIVYTITKLSDFEPKLKEITEKINSAISYSNEERKTISEKLHENQFYTKFTPISTDDEYKRINSQEKRLIKAFPKLRSIKYNETLEKIKQYISNKTDNDD